MGHSDDILLYTVYGFHFRHIQELHSCKDLWQNVTSKISVNCLCMITLTNMELHNVYKMNIFKVQVLLKSSEICDDLRTDHPSLTQNNSVKTTLVDF